MPMKLDAHIENMYSMSSDLKMSTMKSEAGRGGAVVFAGASCAATTEACAASSAAAPVAAPARKLRRSTAGFSGSSIGRVSDHRLVWLSICAPHTARLARATCTERHRIPRLRRFGLGDVMAKSGSRVDRRKFLRGAAAAALTAPAIPAAAQPPADAPRPAAPPISPAQASQALAAETAPLAAEVEALTVDNPGSDFMVDVLRTLGFDYVIANPASSFRGLHESFINYGGNASPEWLTCAHEQAAVNIANGYFAVAGRPAAVVTFAPSGLQHAAMGIFGAFSGHADVSPVREHPGRGGPSAAVRL